MKGRWVIDLVTRVYERGITPQEGIKFAFARIKPKPTHFSLEHICFNSADHSTWSIAWEIFLRRRYCPKGFEINERDVVVDVGAHRGIFTAFAANRTKAQIISIEPNPDNFTALCKFLGENQWKQVVPIHGAVASTSGTIRLFQSPFSSRHSITGVDPVNKQIQTDSIDVPAYTLETILQNVAMVDLLKVDCEGAEFEILLNSGELLNRVRRISMEIHLAAPGADLIGLQTFLKKFYRNIVFVQESLALGYLFAS